MAPDQHNVKCAICGKAAVLPQGPDRLKARCTACGSPLAAQAPPEPPNASAPPPRPAQRPAPPGRAPPATPAAQGTQVTCAVCGKQMVIPHGYENRKARCTACGTEIGALSPLEVLDQPGRPNLDPLAAPDLPPHPADAPPAANTVICAICGKQMEVPSGQSAANMRCSACGTALGAPSPLADLNPPASAPKKRPAYTTTSKWADVREALLPGVLWGILGSIVGGVPMLAYRIVEARRMTEALPVAATIAFAGTGASIGFVLCTTWVIVRKAALGPVASTALCGGLSLILGTFFYVFEWAFVAPSDFGLLLNAVVCTMAGGITGLALHYTIAYFE